MLLTFCRQPVDDFGATPREWCGEGVLGGAPRLLDQPAVGDQRLEAGAAELLTGALQDRGRAVVVGSRTFGKGSVQMPSRLPDGSVAELTVGHYRTPSGRTVDGRGIAPDLPADQKVLQRAETVLSGLGDS
ncbi:S41 family peptidase [Micromonospora chersina]